MLFLSEGLDEAAYGCGSLFESDTIKRYTIKLLLHPRLRAKRYARERHKHYYFISTDMPTSWHASLHFQDHMGGNSTLCFLLATAQILPEKDITKDVSTHISSMLAAGESVGHGLNAKNNELKLEHSLE